MQIHYDKESQCFHLTTTALSYGIHILHNRYLSHCYFGRQTTINDFRRTLPSHLKVNDRLNDKDIDQLLLDKVPLEYPTYGHSDYRYPALGLLYENGSSICDLYYQSYEISDLKPEIKGLPQTFSRIKGDSKSLNIVLEDPITNLQVHLRYTVFRNYPIITRSAKIINQGLRSIKIQRALSASIDFQNSNYDVVHLTGAWAREFQLERHPLVKGILQFESRRGTSGHQHNPVLMLVDPGATEEYGDAYAFGLIYSGSFINHIEVDQFNRTRFTTGINPFNFHWQLEPGDSFHTPEVIIAYSDEGMNGISTILHNFALDHLSKNAMTKEIRPIVINTWETSYFNVNQEIVLKLAEKASQVGCEILVIDDGWFGFRQDDKNSLGDWVLNQSKFPNGLKWLSEKLNTMDLKLGLWFEPEMISPKSDLYKAHPDWCLSVPQRTRTEERWQLVLDLCRSDVCDFVIQTISNAIETYNLAYIKWDMNRYLSNVGSSYLSADQQGEIHHRYMLGLYHIMDSLVTRFSNVLFENCSSGGGRFDYGMLYYFPQTWTSDNSDAGDRLKIQYGASLFYPISAMTAHVSASPNHQLRRSSSLSFRGHVAMSGNLGYELDLSLLTDEELRQVGEQIMYYKSIRELIQFGKFIRLKSPYVSNDTAWLFHSKDQLKAILFYFRRQAEVNVLESQLRLRGLKCDQRYKELNSAKHYSGSELMTVGLQIPVLEGDYQSLCFHFTAV